jgi:hypothetical protein
MRILLLLNFFAAVCAAQYKQSARNSFLHHDIQQAFEHWNISRPTLEFHAAFRPYLSSTYRKGNDSLLPFTSAVFNHLFFSKNFNERPQKRNWYNIQVHPIIDAEGGYDPLLSRVRSAVVGGTHLKLNINDDFTFAGTVVGGNMQFPFFIDTTIALQQVVPEFGQAYPSRLNAGYNLFDWQGYLSYSPLNNGRFNFQLGRDKHFIGNGYRSLLLSDFAPAYPYFRINANVWRLQYNVWYSWMYDVTQSERVKRDYRNKFGTFHFLSYNITKELNVSFFENVVWRGSDTNQVRTFDVNYLNPVIFFRPVEYSLGSSDNSFIGMNVSGILFRKLRLYAQLALDEFYLKEIRARRGWWANKQGWQFGMKYINAFGLRGLSLQAEYNEVRPYTYTHGLVDQNYGHYGYALAHPFGANFREFLGIITVRRDRWQVSAQGMYALLGKDTLYNNKSNVGQNIFLSYTTRPFEYGHHTTQGIQTTVALAQLKFTLHLVPALNLRAELGLIQRAEKNEMGYILQNPYYFLALRSSFWNSYRDF